ncbi:uncharacterized protein LOC131399923 [Diceros bicornis minor]|uniref:uncharacterized protein LOC131399923 n=1 Tax=Diceros bicornis minor TaxID=77932 RepID=UPI0026F2C98F|nr:uncharacterized protein LOC131399923 [Diceros bicornis minor]
MAELWFEPRSADCSAHARGEGMPETPPWGHPARWAELSKAFLLLPLLLTPQPPPAAPPPGLTSSTFTEAGSFSRAFTSSRGKSHAGGLGAATALPLCPPPLPGKGGLSRGAPPHQSTSEEAVSQCCYKREWLRHPADPSSWTLQVDEVRHGRRDFPESVAKPGVSFPSRILTEQSIFRLASQPQPPPLPSPTWRAGGAQEPALGAGQRRRRNCCYNWILGGADQAGCVGAGPAQQQRGSCSSL